MLRRLKFARDHRNWGYREWSSVVFTDECAFKLINTTNRIFVRRRADEAYQPNTIQPSDSYSKTVMIWGAISVDGVGPLVRINETVDSNVYISILRHWLRRYYPGLYGGGLIFQQDNAPAHRTSAVDEWFEGYGIEVLDWPTKSPDLNIIEGIWSHLKYKFRGRIFRDEDELWRELQKFWRQVGDRFIQNYYRSLPNRMRALIKAKGGYIKY